MKCFFAAVLVLSVTSAGLAQSEPQDKHDSSRWTKAIADFEKQDKATPSAKNGILFVGSSSIRKWDTKQSFPELPVINRGFGGSQIADSVQNIETLVLKHKPKVVVMYAGDNDLNAGKSPERVFADFAEFVAILKKNLPETKLCFVAIKPSIKRWSMMDRIRTTNGLVESYCKLHQDLAYIDIVEPMLGKDGKPMPDLFVKDGLHLSQKGYDLWIKALKPTMLKQFEMKTTKVK